MDVLQQLVATLKDVIKMLSKHGSSQPIVELPLKVALNLDLFPEMTMFFPGHV